MRKKVSQILQKLNDQIIVVFFILGLISFFCFSYSQQPSHKEEVENKSVDTYIPAGFVLVPLDLVNIESLNSFIGDHGVVDLFQSLDGQKGKKIASKIKVIRAPLNPQLYAALIPEKSAQELLSHAGPFLAVVQNKTQDSGGIRAQLKRNSHVHYQN